MSKKNEFTREQKQLLYESYQLQNSWRVHQEERSTVPPRRIRKRWIRMKGKTKFQPDSIRLVEVTTKKSLRYDRYVLEPIRCLEEGLKRFR